MNDSNFENVRPKGSKLKKVKKVQKVKVDGPEGERGNAIGIDLLTF